MTKFDLAKMVKAAKGETREALQTMYDAMNHGQQQQIVKDEEVLRLFELYGVDYQ